jgi:hypothetical protein
MSAQHLLDTSSYTELEVRDFKDLGYIFVQLSISINFITNFDQIYNIFRKYKLKTLCA